MLLVLVMVNQFLNNFNMLRAPSHNHVAFAERQNHFLLFRAWHVECRCGPVQSGVRSALVRVSISSETNSEIFTSQNCHSFLSMLMNAIDQRIWIESNLQTSEHETSNYRTHHAPPLDNVSIDAKSVSETVSAIISLASFSPCVGPRMAQYKKRIILSMAVITSYQSEVPSLAKGRGDVLWLLTTTSLAHTACLALRLILFQKSLA